MRWHTIQETSNRFTFFRSSIKIQWFSLNFRPFDLLILNIICWILLSHACQLVLPWLIFSDDLSTLTCGNNVNYWLWNWCNIILGLTSCVQKYIEHRQRETFSMYCILVKYPCNSILSTSHLRFYKASLADAHFLYCSDAHFFYC